MNAPIFSRSVAEFWGKRWNLAFRDYAHLTIFAPLARISNPVVATLSGFLFSGLIHELAISIPAKGGYGLPTIYFLIQGLAILAERWIDKKLFRIRGRLSGYLFTMTFVVAPAPLLFHRHFVKGVVTPVVEIISKL